jgi:MFS family permease
LSCVDALPQVFYSIGFSGIIYTVAVLAADVTSLRNRGIAFAFTSSPYMITAFAGSKAAEAFLLNVKNWRWGFGSFAIIVPVITAPLFVLLKLQLRKAEKQGLIAEQVMKSWTFDRIWKNIVAFDCKLPFTL